MTDFIPRAVLFDMDGLILDTERIAQMAWRLAGAPMGLEMSDIIYSQLIGRKLSDIEVLLLAHFGPDIPLREWFAQADIHYKRMTLEEELPVKEGIHELLNLLDRLQMPRIVATSTTTVLARKKLEKVELLHRFYGVVGGDQVLHGKPAPDIYLKAADFLKIPIEQCLVLEDSEPGIIAGHAAGAKAIMVPDLVQPQDGIRALAYAIYPDLNRVCEWLVGVTQGEHPPTRV